MNIRDIVAIEMDLKLTNLLTYMRIFDVLYEIPQRRKSDPAAIKFTDIYQKHCHRSTAESESKWWSTIFDMCYAI